MNINDLHLAFKVELDKNSSGYSFAGNPALLPGEIDYWLNKALIQTINTKFTGNNKLQEPFESSVKRNADLEKLVKTDTGLTLLVNPNSNTLQLSDFSTNSVIVDGTVRMFYIQSVLVFGTKKANIDLITHEQSKKFLKTYNNNPWIPEPVATLHDDKLTIFIDNTTMTGTFTLELTYVKKPTKLSYTDTTEFTELPDYVYNEIVSTAVALTLDNIESKRIETKLQLNTLTE